MITILDLSNHQLILRNGKKKEFSNHHLCLWVLNFNFGHMAKAIDTIDQTDSAAIDAIVIKDRSLMGRSHLTILLNRYSAAHRVNITIACNVEIGR